MFVTEWIISFVNCHR